MALRAGDQAWAPASVQVGVTVQGESPVVYVRRSAVANAVTETTVQQIPTSRRFTDLLNTMPGVQNGQYTFSPINAVYGSKVTDNVYQVDGINFVDPQVSAPITEAPSTATPASGSTTAPSPELVGGS